MRGEQLPGLTSTSRPPSVLLMRIIRKAGEEDKGKKLIFTCSDASVFSQVSTKLEEANFHKKIFSGLTVKYRETNIGDRGKDGLFFFFCFGFVIGLAGCRVVFR